MPARKESEVTDAEIAAILETTELYLRAAITKVINAGHIKRYNVWLRANTGSS